MKKTNTFILLIVGILCCTSSLFAQRKKQTVVDFSKGGDKVQRDEAPINIDTAEHFNALWIEGTSALFGYVDLSYEHSFTENFAVEAGLGITFFNFSPNLNDIIWKNNIYPGGFKEAQYWTDKNYDLVAQTPVTMETLTFKNTLGIYALLEPKFYTGTEDFSGLYYGLRMEYMTFNSLAPKPDIAKTMLLGSDVLLYSTETTPILQTYTNLVPHFGYAWNLDRFLINLEGGLGARLSSIKGYDVGKKYDPISQQYSYEMRQGFTQSRIFPVFTIAFKLGYNF
jgi:hypothetical protein